jgi:hypothetical protein
MESVELGFFLGASPGIFCIVRNMGHMFRVCERAKDLAREHGALWLGFSSLSDSYNFIFHPQRYIGEDDNTGTRLAKEMILSERHRYFVHHGTGGVILILGAVGGAIGASALHHFGGMYI